MRIKSGRCYHIFALQEDGKCEVFDFLQVIHQQRPVEFLRLIKNFDRTADLGLIQNIERFRPLGNEIYEFRIATIHILCFINAERAVVLTNGFMKNGSDSDLRHAENVKIRYHAAKLNGYLTFQEDLL